MPRPYSMETRAAAAHATRARLVDAAIEVVAASSPEAVTMQAVAATADVALRTVYNHFSSKEELLAEALERLLADTRVPASEVMAGDLPPQEKLLAFVEETLRSYQRQGPAAAVLMRAQYAPGMEERIRDMRAWRREQLAALVADLERSGPLGLPTEGAVGLAFALTSFAAWSSLVTDSGLEPDEAVATVRHAVATALRPRPG